MDTDESLMLKYCDGCYDSFQQLYSRHKGPVYRFILRHLGDAETANEIHQDTWLRIINAREKYQSTAKFTTYLYTVVNNLLIDHSRRGSTHIRSFAEPMTTENEAASHMDTMRHAIIDDCIALMRESLSNIPIAQRDAFVLQQEAGHSLEQIAEIMNTSRETIKSRLRHAIKTLRERLKDCL